jgi:hypothetical protein
LAAYSGIHWRKALLEGALKVRGVEIVGKNQPLRTVQVGDFEG